MLTTSQPPSEFITASNKVQSETENYVELYWSSQLLFISCMKDYKKNLNYRPPFHFLSLKSHLFKLPYSL